MPVAKLPCDIYADDGHPCVAAHSTTRALFGAYSGKLYQVKRESDSGTKEIVTMSQGGYADGAAQDAFCANTNCVITIIFDQSSQHNDLAISPAGTAGGADVGAKAAMLPAMAGGHKVYGVYVTPGTGYRNVTATGTAHNLNASPQDIQGEGIYMVAGGRHVNNDCCFDYGNTEQPAIADTGNGHMDAVYFGTICGHDPCPGSGPWIGADLENGIFQGNGPNPKDLTVKFDLVTAMLKNDSQTKFALKTGNAQAGGLTTQYDGTLPQPPDWNDYIPMKQEGGITLGVGGDNSNRSAGDFYEGVMTSGYPSDAAEDAVQANIVSVGYVAAQYKEVVPTSEKNKQNWRYYIGDPGNQPDGTWMNANFDDSSWTTGKGGFGSAGTPGAIIGTDWTTPGGAPGDIWLRRKFDASNLTPAQLAGLILRIHHDEDAEVYVNGVLATAVPGWTISYDFYQPMSKDAKAAIMPNGNNVLAVHCHQTAGGQFIDVGISALSL
jgi:hypothetical protein